MKNVSMLIKPASGRCNLRCRYCFYHDISEKRAEHDLGLMSEETLEILVREAYENASESVSFAFQGGEPMLRGLSFFQKFIELEDKYNIKGIRTGHSIQTNATLIDEKWADFFYRNDFLVGVSIDGRQLYHDRYRVYPDGSGSWDKVKNSLLLLQQKNVQANALCVVTADIALRAKAAYRGLKALGMEYIQFIPCLDPIGEERGKEPYSLTPALYGEFLNTVFDLYYDDWNSGKYVSVRLFDDYVHLLSGAGAGSCAAAGNCGDYFVIEADGSVYPCDFFVLDNYKTGKITDTPLAELLTSPAAESFKARGRSYPKECEGCGYLYLCRGGCQRDWISDEKNANCKAFKSFFAYAGGRLKHMAEEEKKLRDYYLNKHLY